MVDASRTAFQHGRCVVSANSRTRLCSAMASLAMLAISAAPAVAQALSFAPVFRFEPAMPRYAPQEQSEDSGSEQLPAQLRRQVVPYQTTEAPGTIIIDTSHTFLYLTLGRGMAMRYGIGVGRQGFTWSGVETIVRKSEWPDWIPPAEMVARQPYLPRWVGGGPGNPLGARAMYLGSSAYRIHGTNDPTTIGKFVSSGCIRLTNEDVADLFSRVDVGTRVVVLPKNSPRLEARGLEARAIPVRPAPARSVTTTSSSGRQAMNLSMSTLY